MWMRCSVGQSWDKKKNMCIGNSTPLTWRQAKQSADDLVLATNTQWRLPSIHELSAIVELRCANPAIDLKQFPNTPPTHYWTNTAFVNQENHFWLVQFLNGENHTDSAKRMALVRLVKTLGQKN